MPTDHAYINPAHPDAPTPLPFGDPTCVACGRPEADPVHTVAHARSNDPETSVEAATSIGHTRPRIAAVVDVLRRIEPAAHRTLVHEYGMSEYGVRLPQSPSGIRSRAKEAVDAGLVEWTGDWVVMGGRRHRTWRTVDATTHSDRRGTPTN